MIGHFACIFAHEAPEMENLESPGDECRGVSDFVIDSALPLLEMIRHLGASAQASGICFALSPTLIDAFTAPDFRGMISSAFERRLDGMNRGKDECPSSLRAIVEHDLERMASLRQLFVDLDAHQLLVTHSVKTEVMRERGGFFLEPGLPPDTPLDPPGDP